jgi:hypothetical protein
VIANIKLKKIKTIIVIVFSIVVVLQLYYRYTYGSIIIYTGNNSFTPDLEGGNYEVDLFLDDKMLTTYTFKNNEMLPREFIINRTFGKYSLKIHRKDKDIVQEYNIYSILVNWVIIDINEDNFYITSTIFPPLLQ